MQAPLEEAATEVDDEKSIEVVIHESESEPKASKAKGKGNKA